MSARNGIIAKQDFDKHLRYFTRLYGISLSCKSPISMSLGPACLPLALHSFENKRAMMALDRSPEKT